MMEKTDGNIEKIACKNCGASLELLGNIHRSKNLCCAYCGTVMDSQHEFKALYTFTHIRQPSTPLSIGMQGVIQNVNFTITGYIAYKSKQEEWLHFQLYSPTHGYAVLVRKNDRYVFLRRTFYLPDKNLWTLKCGDDFKIEQQSFRVNELLIAEVFYAAGNLITEVHQSKRNKQCFSQSQQQWFLSIQKKDSVEYYRGYEMDDAKLEVFS